MIRRIDRMPLAESDAFRQTINNGDINSLTSMVGS